VSDANPREGSRLSPFAAGVIAILVTAAFTYLAFGGRLPWSGGYEIKAVVQSGNELHARTPVRIAGVEVGKVKKVEKGPGGTAVVTMEVQDKARPIHTDATLKVRPRIFLEGNFFIDVQPGSPSAPELKHGGKIPLSQTAMPVQLDQILSTLERPTRDDLRSLLDGLGQGLDRGGVEALRRSLPDWAPAFAATSQASEAFRGLRERDLSELIADGEKVFAALAARRERLPVLVRGLNRTLGPFADRRAELRESVRELDGLLAEASPTLDAVNRALPPVRALSIEIRPGLRVAPQTLRLALPLLDQLAGAISPREIPALLRELRPVLGPLSRLQPELTRLLDLLEPATECLRRNALPALKTPIEDPPLSTGYPVYLDLLHALPGLASGSQNFNGNGTSVRYHAGFGDQVVTLGRAPSTNEVLVGLTSEEMLGSRPAPTGVRPPFRPDVPCVTQRRVDLRAATGPAPQQEPAPAVPLLPKREVGR
jgi:phospholipid/cholesterol/gamma-HCH transport system substrate-binding protein